MSVTVNPFRVALATHSTSTSFAAKSPAADKPSGGNVIDLLNDIRGLAIGQQIPRFLQLLPFGSAANNKTFDMRLWGWSRALNASGSLVAYAPQILVELNVTLGNIAATPLGASNFLADTIVIAKGDENSPLISPVNDTPASVLVHLRGCELIEFDWDLAGGDEATSMNCLWRLMDQ